MTVTLFHQENARNREILNACGRLRDGFRPRPWARNPHAQIALLLNHGARSPELLWDRVEELKMADGGVVSLQWHGVEQATPTTPIALVLPTICGDGDGVRDITRQVGSSLGWTVVVCNRRGHAGVPLATPRFNTLGNVDDLRAQIAHVRAAHPRAPLFAIGVSAGSGLLARYLGETPDTPVVAGVMHCPGYDLRDMFEYVHPVYNRLMARRLKSHFLDPNAALLSELPATRACATARDLAEFHQHVYPLSGFATREDYLRSSNPMEVAHDITVPMLVLNAVDDPICSIRMVERVRRSLIAALPHSILAVTRYGSHCAHLGGVRARVSWAHSVIVDYLRANARLEAS